MSSMGIAQVIMIIIALTTVGVGVFSRQQPQLPPKNQVLSDSSEPTPSPSASTAPVHSTPTPSPSASPTTQASPSDSLIYPGSTIVAIAQDTTKLTSVDSPEDIFKWYQDHIKKLGFSATSIAKTNTNNNFLAKLNGADGDTNLQIEIKRGVGDTLTLVEVRQSE